jgi:multiple sugar transport system substrate-binding protein
MPFQYRALTWDHPRGYNALAAAAARLDPAQDGFTIIWDKQPLEGFESHPIEDLCARYDLIVLDHPHIGEAFEGRCLQSLEDIFGAEAVRELEEATIGPCLSSYRFRGRHWALPLDAATQVMAARKDLLDGPLPTTWDDVRALSNESGKVALSLAGPHALMTFMSMAVAFGEPPAERDPDLLVSPRTGELVLDLMRQLAARSPSSVWDKNPIGLLGHMAVEDDVALCPLVYGYVNYAAPRSGTPLYFANAPRRGKGTRPGSTLGGTGIGVSTRCETNPQLKNHLLWLLSEDAQSGFIPSHDGQPSRRSAWKNDTVNRRWNDFYRSTADTLEAAYVRPRHAGYIRFQAEASAMLRDALHNQRALRDVIEQLQTAYSASRKADADR